MKVKISELSGAALDWAVAKCEGLDYWHPEIGPSQPEYSTEWAQGGPVIERKGISVMRVYKGYDEPWCTERGEEHFTEAPTPLIAAMRCYVASEMGNEVEVPEELL